METILELMHREHNSKARAIRDAIVSRREVKSKGTRLLFREEHNQPVFKISANSILQKKNPRHVTRYKSFQSRREARLLSHAIVKGEKQIPAASQHLAG